MDDALYWTEVNNGYWLLEAVDVYKYLFEFISLLKSVLFDGARACASRENPYSFSGQLFKLGCVSQSDWWLMWREKEVGRLLLWKQTTDRELEVAGLSR